MSAFPERVVGSACASAFSRLTQRSLALRPAHSRCHQFVARLPEGFRHFVTSMPAPVASGWSGCRVGFAPTGKRRLFTAHTHSRHWTHRSERLQRSDTSHWRSGVTLSGQITNCRSPWQRGIQHGPSSSLRRSSLREPFRWPRFTSSSVRALGPVPRARAWMPADHRARLTPGSIGATVAL